MKQFAFLCLFVLNIFEESTSRQLPSYLKPCKLTEKDISQCVKNVMNDIRPQLADGIKELGVPPMKKLQITKLKFDLNGGNSNVTTTFTDLVFTGAEDFVIESVNVDPAKGIFDLAMLVPHFQSISKYHLIGRLILLDLETAGDVTLNFTNVLIDSKYVADRYVKNDKEHFKFNVKSFDVTIESFATTFGNLINGNQEITDAVNKAFNDNSDLILEQIRPVVSEAVQKLVTSVLNRAFNRFPIDELYPKQ